MNINNSTFSSKINTNYSGNNQKKKSSSFSEAFKSLDQSVSKSMEEKSNNNVSSSFRRERININQTSSMAKSDGKTFDKSAPKGTYVNLLV